MMVVVPKPPVKGRGALFAVAVDRAVGPTAQHRANEALSLAVGLGTVGTGAQVADAKRPASQSVNHRAVTRAVVREQLMHGHPVSFKEDDGASEEGHDGGGLLIGQDL